METNFIYKSMDIKPTEKSGLLIARTKIWLPAYAGPKLHLDRW